MRTESILIMLSFGQVQTNQVFPVYKCNEHSSNNVMSIHKTWCIFKRSAFKQLNRIISSFQHLISHISQQKNIIHLSCWFADIAHMQKSTPKRNIYNRLVWGYRKRNQQCQINRHYQSFVLRIVFHDSWINVQFNQIKSSEWVHWWKGGNHILSALVFLSLSSS